MVEGGLKPFNWNKQSRQAAWLLGRTTLRTPAIAAEVGVTPETVRKWHKHPGFKDRVRDYEEEELADARRAKYSRRSDRVFALSTELEQQDEIFKQRATDVTEYERGKQGLETGRVVRQYKGFGNGEFLEIRTEYMVDNATVKERRELLKQLAMELGEWNEKGEEQVDSHISILFTEKEQ